MKQATQLALYGTIAIVIDRTVYLLSDLFHFDIYESKIYIALSTIEVIGFISLAYFFYVLYQKQNNKTNNNE